MSNKDFIKIKAKVIKLSSDDSFTVELRGNKHITATIASKFKISKKRIMQGDWVMVEIPSDSLEKGRIISRAN